MKRVQYLCALLLGVVWLLAPSSAAAEKWPIKEFKVFQKKPGDLLGSANVISDAVAKEIERWLERVAQEYESMGFKKPRFTPVKESILSNKKVLPVYVFKYSSSVGGPAAMSHPCAKSTNNFTGKKKWVYSDTYMIFDSGRNLKNGKLTGKAYQDLAHELFHAVQNSYSMFSATCGNFPGGWISEGTAEAVGIEMARKLQAIQPNHVCQMGVRSFSERLYVQPDRSPTVPVCSPATRPYQTQSFWQFLGEYSTRKGFIATEKFAEPDFRYLHNFFSTSYAMGSRSKEYAWLDKVLKTGPHFGIRLQTAYSRFVGSFASYWKPKRRERYPNYTGGSGAAAGGGSSAVAGGIGAPGEKKRKWIEVIFGTCVEFSVTKDPNAVIPSKGLPIGPVASRCIKVNFNFTGRVGLTFYASGLSDKSKLESLVVSTNGGKKIVRRHSAEQVADKIGKFSNITAKKGIPQYFILSNVAKKASATVSIDPTITIVPEIATTKMAKEKKEPDPNSDPTEKEEQKTAAKSRSWKGKVWQNKGRPCQRPFVAAACGPRTDIGLLLVPDTAHLAETLAQPSMSLERKFRLFDDVIQEGSESFVSDMVDDYMAIQQEDGAGVSIAIPQIQPGFTGTISNAHIDVSKAIEADGTANGGYRAVGPWVGSCRDGYWPATGTVTIKEFSKKVLRGTFSADLMDMTNVGTCESGPISKSNSGSFSITEIDWNLGFESPELDEDAIIDDIVDDFNATIPGLMSDDLVEYAKEQARKKQQEREQAKQEKTKADKKSTGFKPRDCDCQKKLIHCEANPQSPLCQFCEPIFNICKGHSQSHSAPLTAEEQAKEDAEVQAMRQRYEAYVDSLPLPHEAFKQQMMNVFDQLETINDKTIFMMSIPN